MFFLPRMALYNLHNENKHAKNRVITAFVGIFTAFVNICILA